MTEATRAATAPPRMDSRYFEEAATWERDRLRAGRFSKGLAWTIATNSEVLSNNQWRVTLLAATNGQRFFRLEAP